MKHMRPTDKEELVVNPVTGKLDMVRIFDPNRIITAQRNSAGHILRTYDVETGQYLDDAPEVVTDLNGNLVTI